VDALRNLFPLKDGDIFSLEKIVKGLDNLRFSYLEMGYVNFRSVPDTRVNEESRTISLDVDVDEGRQFYVSNINVIGHGADVSQDLFLKPGDIYNQRLARLFIQEDDPSSLADASPDSRIHLQLDEQAGTLAIIFDFRECPAKEQQ
jgi:outer membrane protein insertion porin family